MWSINGKSVTFAVSLSFTIGIGDKGLTRATNLSGWYNKIIIVLGPFDDALCPGVDAGFLKGRRSNLGLHAKKGRGQGSSFGPSVKKPTSWVQGGGPDPPPSRIGTCCRRAYRSPAWPMSVCRTSMLSTHCPLLSSTSKSSKSITMIFFDGPFIDRSIMALK